MWLKNQQFQRLGGGGWLERFGLGLWSSLQMKALRAHKEPAKVKLLAEVQKQGRSLLGAWEQFLIHSIAQAQTSFPNAAMAEVGVFRGGSARLICEAKGDVPLYLFDTFEGLPPSSQEDGGVHRQHQYTCSLENVREYLQKFPNVHYFQGTFPESTAGVPEQQYSLAHFDVDLYDGTKACLAYFYPRMVSGGILLTHDYSLLAGVKQAFDEFFADKPEKIIELPSTQCMVVKR